MTWSTSMAIAVCAALSVPACGVMSSSTDCVAKAACADEEGGSTIDATAMDVEAGEAAAADGGADEASDANAGGSSEAGGGDGPARAGDGCAATEDCTNGVDDNCDGLIDCADPTCQAAYTCVPPVPQGWTGPVEFWQANNPATAPPCDTGYGAAQNGQGGFAGPPATCRCTCGATGQACSPKGTFFPNQNCTGGTVGVTVADGSCTAVPSNSLGDEGSFSITVPTAPSGGSCNASPTMSLASVTWESSALVCSYMGRADSPGGCAATDLCVQAPGGSFPTKACVVSPADPPPTSCPAGYAATGPTVFYSGHTDNRSCAPCSCAGAPAGGACSGTVDLYGNSNGGCAGAADSYTLTADGGCACYGKSGCPAGIGLLYVNPGYVKGSFTVTPGSCAPPTQPAPAGSASPTAPVTVCCM